MLPRHVLVPAAWFAPHGPARHDIRTVRLPGGPAHIEHRTGHRLAYSVGTLAGRIASLCNSSIGCHRWQVCIVFGEGPVVDARGREGERCRRWTFSVCI